ncbi:GbsR/MarR family transcriptional regulator [Chitinophaga rhizosphaerae]|uniref:GbsR/MarR family transcriptional regulator n=1 Tax=Chitinophaga rhizosphaerae TaxID=1864947 RepID=UPI000F809C2F|nr:helix-turn-helix transcriptional regulator [Chitinophaga rhizosphaerae]
MEIVSEAIEYHGKLMESMGLSPMASRIYLYLICSGEGQAGFAELVAHFQASKSAVSNALALLVNMQLVVPRQVEGRRKRYFAVNLTGMFDPVNLSRRFTAFRGMLDDVRLRRGKDDALSGELAKVSGFYQFMEAEFPKLLQRWKATLP